MSRILYPRRLACAVRRVGIACLVAGAGAALSSCSDNLLTGTPEWLGSSIYEELESRGNFQTTLALINDKDLSETNYPEMLRRTGSMTLFVAPDTAWNRWLTARGVKSVNDLSKAEKKNLLKAAMVNNAYLIELLSNTPGDPPSEGACMRRTSRLDISDSIPVVNQAQFPALNPKRLDGEGNVTDYWAAVRDRQSILLYKDNSAAPMVHFLPDFMLKNDLTSEDLSKLTNGAASDVNSTNYINGQRVVEQDVTCQNGYIHVLAAVPESLDNMAEIVNTKPQFSIFSTLLDRFSYPYFLATQSVDGKEDSLFVKRYFNNGGQNHGLNKVVETDKTVSSVLSLDPGWNQYVINTSNQSATYQNDGAAFFVPSDDAMRHYLSPQGEGSAIGEKYAYDWDNVPDDVVLPFINNCLKSSFVSTSPSKFANVRNTASEDMGIKVADVDSCFMACNGVVYQLNKPFVAPEHQSVLFPAMLRADEDLSVIYKAITDTRYSDRSTVTANWTLNEYQAYVNSMASTYSFLIPTDDAFANYIDPYSIYENKPIGYKFYVDPSNSTYPVSAKAYEAEQQEDGTYRITDKAATGSTLVSLALVNNRLQDVLENIIVVHGQKGAQPFHPQQTIYVNKAGGPVQVRFEGSVVTGVAGSQAMERERYITVKEEETTDLTHSGNGVAYVINEIPATTLTSPYKVITDTLNHPEYKAFARLLVGSSFVGEEVNKHPSMDKALSILGNYNYTLYIPTSDKVEALQTAGKLPSWELFDEWDEYPTIIQEYADAHPGTYTEAQLDSIADVADSVKTLIRNTIENFVRYHIQDGSIYLGGADTTSIFETAAVDTAMSRFRRITVENNTAGYSVTDAQGHKTHVIASTASNRATRQYLFTKATRFFYSTAYAVVHLLDDVLTYADNQFLDPATMPVCNYPEESVKVQGFRSSRGSKTSIRNVMPQWKPQHDPENMTLKANLK